MNIRVSDRRQFIFRLIGTLLSIGLIILLVRQGGWTDIVDALKKISFSDVLLALVFIFYLLTSPPVPWSRGPAP